MGARKNMAILLGLMMAVSIMGQGPYKREMRAVWVASVANLDWPNSVDRGNYSAQKADLLRMLDLYQSLNMNAMLLQVRPECDALYQSAYEPWSRYLSTNQGDDPGYDPLQFAIEEAHKRGIELHAWVNPYRINASANDGGSYYHETHIYKEHPEWAIEYGDGKNILNPGRPEVMSYIGDVVRDLVSKYGVDGVHFDDYFYSYQGTDYDLDQVEYELYGGGMSRGDWRRDNINRMIDTVYRVIQEADPTVRFGVSPFGIYRPGVPSGITGMDAYNVIYCDPLAWLEDGNLDYLTPQLYWPTGGGQDFETLTNWWSEQVDLYDRHLCPGQGTYRLGSNPDLKGTTTSEDQLHELKGYMDQEVTAVEKGTSDPVAPWTLGQIGLQVDIIRSNHDKGAMGSIFFRADDLDRVTGLADYLKDNKYLYPTLMPEMHWKADDTPGTPQNIEVDTIGDMLFLTWEMKLLQNQRFAVYVSDGESDETIIIKEATFLQGTFIENQVELSELVLSANSWITVTTVSATGREGIPSSAIAVNMDNLAQLVSPDSEATIGQSDMLQWSSELTDPRYQLQIASNASFSNIIYQSEWTVRTEAKADSLNLEGESSYSWRVRAKETVSGPWTAARTFHTGFPKQAVLSSPVNLALNVSTTPLVKWSNSAACSQIRVQISTESSFESILHEDLFDASLKQGILSTELEKSYWYYIRIQGINDYGISSYTGLSAFQTSAGEFPGVELLSPADQTTVASFDQLQWGTTATEGEITYQLEVAIDEDFLGILYRSAWMSSDRILISDMNLEGKRIHYWRVKAKSEFGESDFTASWVFTSGYPTRPSLTAPPHLTDGVSARPLVGWNVDPDTDSVLVEFAEKVDFVTIYYREIMDAKPGSGQITGSLRGYTWYYCQIKAINDYGQSINSSRRYFGTSEGTVVESAESKREALEIFPSPLSDGALNIRYHSDNDTGSTIILTNSTGQVVFKRIVTNTNHSGVVKVTIDHNKFPAPGIYFIIITEENRVFTCPIVVNK